MSRTSASVAERRRTGTAPVVVVLLAAAAGVLVTRSPLVALGAVGAAAVLAVAWPRGAVGDIEIVAGAILLVSITSSAARQASIGGVGIAPVIAVVEVVAALLLLLHDSKGLGASWQRLWPFALFLVFSSLSLVAAGVSTDGVQNVVVFTAFVVIATLAFVRARRDPALGRSLEVLFERGYWLLAALGALSVAAYGPGGGFLVRVHGSSRSFALLMLLMLSGALARWRHGGGRRALLMVATAMPLIALSLSRSAFVTACVLVALAWFLPRSVAGTVRFLAGLGTAIVLFWAGVTFIQPLHQRFYADRGDLVTVGGYQLNANGRTTLWGLTWDEFLRSPWIGHGAGTSEVYLTRLGGADHPHNDYLRLLSDYGVIGAGLWILGIVSVVATTFGDWRRRDAASDRTIPDPVARTDLWCILAVAAVLAAMVTDNPIVYLHVQAPFALIVGTALGAASASRRTRSPIRSPAVAPVPEAAGGGAATADPVPVVAPVPVTVPDVGRQRVAGAGRSAVRGLLADITREAGKHPSLFLPYARWRIGNDFDGLPCVIGPETEAVIEGFPRSGNTFAVAAFRIAQARPVPLAHHVHAPAQVVAGVRRSLPVVVLVRRPDDAIVSMMARTGIRPDAALKTYLTFYESTVPILDDVLVAPFPVVIGSFGSVIRVMNDRFGRDFAVFEDTRENVARVMASIEARGRRDAASSGRAHEAGVARPSAARDAQGGLVRARFERHADADLRARARRVYRRLLAASPFEVPDVA